MIAARLERIGEAFAIRLTQNAVDLLGLSEGDAVRLTPGPDGTISIAADGPDSGYDDRHERGRAFLKRYMRSLDPSV